MTDHYYSEEPLVAHNRKTIAFNYRGLPLKFITDSGVFSKERVDYGSQLLLDSLFPPPASRVLDLGCGYGVLGISLAKAEPTLRVQMVDINARAIELAKENILLNDLTNCQASQGDGFANLQSSFDLIVTNPPIRAGKAVIYSLFAESKEYLKKEGSLYLVIQKKQGANSAINELMRIYGNCQKVNKSAGYWVLKSSLGGPDGRNI